MTIIRMLVDLWKLIKAMANGEEFEECPSLGSSDGTCEGCMVQKECAKHLDNLAKIN